MKIYLDSGHNHSGADTGAQGNGLREQDVTYHIAQKVGDRLKNAGVTVKYSRDTIVSNVGTTLAESLNLRCKSANLWGADYFVSIHCNAATNATANGTETLVYSVGGEAEKLAKIVNANLVEMGLTNRGVKVRTDLAVLKNTNMSAILVETAFISNPSDANILAHRQDDIAQAIANGILKFLGIEVNDMAKIKVVKTKSGGYIYLEVDGKKVEPGGLFMADSTTGTTKLADLLRAVGHDVSYGEV